MKTKGMGIALLSAAALLGGAAAQAAELSWTYAEVGYNKADAADDFETDAYDIKGSVGFAGIWHASLDYLDGTADNSGSGNNDLDFDGFRLVVGAHPQLTPNTQLVTDLTYFDYDYDGGEGATGNSDGYGVGLGLRHSLTDKVELLGEIWYTDGSVDQDGGSSDDYSDTTVQLAARYNWTPAISTGVSVDLGGTLGAGTSSLSSSSGGDVIRFDARWSFGGGVDGLSDSY
jgi:hypothetical protein